jgi:hypothetical protein
MGTSNTNNGVVGTSSTNNGIVGLSTSGSAGVVGTTPGNFGVYGYTSANEGVAGVYGASNGNYGVFGTTNSGQGVGVFGYETASGTGVYGFSTSGIGARTTTNTGYGLFAGASTSGTGILINTSSGPGLIANTTGGVPVLTHNSNGNGGDFTGSYIGLVGRAPTGGFPLVLTDNAGNVLFYVDGAGNLNYNGALLPFARLAGGAKVRAFSATTTQATVEDTGTAQLVGGAGVVRLDPTFAAAMDRASTYRVFLTPAGDTHGLFVAAKTANGFIVRESQGGHATVNFDYRIVATALGQAGQRMAVTSSAAIPRAAAPVMPAKPASLTPQVPPAAPKASR